MMRVSLYLLYLVHITFSVDIQRGPENPYAETSKCELIRIAACQGLPYNHTILPNTFGHTSQEEAGQDVTQYNSLVKIPCNPSLKLFLCSLYFPVCTELRKPLPPCRSLCQQNRDRCEPIMRSFSFQWPANMQCELFPEDGLCISEDKPETKPAAENALECPAEMKVPTSFEFRIRLSNNQIIPNCGMPCKRHLFNDPSWTKFSRLWIGLWSGLCAASTLFTVLTFLIDMNRFQYPERPIIFLSFCYLVVAVTYITGLSFGDKIACAGPFVQTAGDGTSGATEAGGEASQQPLLVTQGTKFEGCIILFMLLYFFSMAGHIWWVVLTVTWYLAAKCHWAHEAIFRNAQYLHFAAWAIPAAMTICILAMGKVDGDPLSGVCFTGLTDPMIVRGFLIVPLCLCLLVGGCFLIAGFVSLFKIRTIIKTGGSKTDDLEKLIVRIGVFSLLYVIPAGAVIGCYIYESRKMDQWMLTWYINEVCRNFDPRKLTESVCLTQLHKLMDSGALHRPTDLHTSPLISARGEPLLSRLEKPVFELFMMKYLMNLIVGITSGIWIWSGKTLVSWHTFFARLCRRPLPAAAAANQSWRGIPRAGGTVLPPQKQQLLAAAAVTAASGPPQTQQQQQSARMAMHELPPIGSSSAWPRGTPSGATAVPTDATNSSYNSPWSSNAAGWPRSAAGSAGAGGAAAGGAGGNAWTGPCGTGGEVGHLNYFDPQLQ
uniref:Frizzled-1 n=1 Tax=Schistocephalus solidus TaxID=70667 RepID=A0A0X3PZN9_SCHSO